MASIHKEADRDGYRVRWREAGRNLSRGCPDYGTAKKLKESIDRAEALGERWTPETARYLTPIGDVLSEFIKAKKRKKLTTQTLRLYAQHLDIFEEWLHATEPRRKVWNVDVLSRDLLERYWDWLGEPNGLHGRKRLPSTQWKYMATVELVWRWASGRDDKFSGVPRARSILEEMQKPETELVEAPTWEQMDHCIAELEGVWQRRAAIVMRFTGLRIQQVMGLRWDDFDLQRRVLYFRGELGKSKQERRGRTVPISEHLVAEMAGWGRRAGWLVPSLRQGANARVFRSRDIARAWMRAGVRTAIWSGRPDHAFRKGVESGLLGVGAAFHRVDFLIGHSVQGAAVRYIDTTIAFPVEAMREIVALIPPLTLAFPSRSQTEQPEPDGAAAEANRRA